MVAFNAIPGNLLVPLFYAEVNSGGSPYEGQSRLLLMGQKLAAGTAAANVPVLVQSENEVIALCGLGSMLVRMYRIARRNAPFQPIWILPLADPAGAAATGTITINTAPSAAGVAVFEICDERITFQVTAADTVTTIAASLVAAINAAGIEVTAANVAGVVTVTSRHVGTVGNAIDLFLKIDEPNILAGRVTIVAMGSATAGTGVPTLTTALANLGDDECPCGGSRTYEIQACEMQFSQGGWDVEWTLGAAPRTLQAILLPISSAFRDQPAAGPVPRKGI